MRLLRALSDKNLLRWPARLALPVALVVAGVWFHRAFRDPAELSALIGRGGRGAATLGVGGALFCALGGPRQAVAFAGGYAFGAWRGGALAMAAQLAGCVFDYAWARLAAWDRVRRRLPARLVRVRGFLLANPFASTLALRLLPVGNNLLLNLLAGAAGLPAWPFLAASLLGYLPQTAIFALMGGGVGVGHGWQAGLGAALFLGAGLCGGWLARRWRALPDMENTDP